MKCDVSDEFEPLDVKAEPLVIHRRPGGIPPNLVVFVHGLGGSRYGTWGSFPKFLFNDFKQDGLDVGLYSYRTAFHRLRLTASIDLEREATVLADAIRDLPSDYRRVILIAHSMGGLLIKAAVTSLIDRDEREALARTAGLILMATPQAGSVRVPRFLGSFSRDARALKPHGELVTRITEIFTDRVSQLPVPDDPRRFVIPVWAVLSPEDLWVDRLSAGLQIPSQRRKEVRGSHTSIVKPEDILDDAYQFVKKAIATCLKPAVGPEGPTNPAPGPAIHPGVTGTTGTTAPDAFLSVVQSQITQVPISMHLPGPLSQIGSQPPVFGMQLAWIGGGQSPAALTQEQVKPRIDELFEVITAPEEVSSALFQTEQAAGLAPYDVDHINAREGVADVQQALETALRQAKGRLLICGPRGIGKTREIAELPRTACATKWKVLVARSEGDPRLAPALPLPRELIDAKLLIVIDNLHTRIMAGADQPTPPYMERFERLLEWLERQMPGSVRVLATARDEPRFQPHLKLPRDERWRSFGLFRLPNLTDEGLRQILTTLATRASVTVAADDVAKLIENSDRKPATVFINVDLARQKRIALTQSAWRPTEGESWRLRFVSARAEHAGVDRVCQALYLLTQAGLPARASYVISVVRASGEQSPENAVDTLVAEDLLRMRQGILTPFSAEQLHELVGQDDKAAFTLSECAETIERSITDPVNRPPEWADDLLALSLGLARTSSMERAEQVASRAIELGAGGSRGYRFRAGVRFKRHDFPGVEADLTKALEIGGDEADTYVARGSIRNLLCNFDGALEDLDLAARHGRDDSEVHSQRATAFCQLARWGDAERELGIAIEHEDTPGMLLFTRGFVRFQSKDIAGAEQDFSAALDRGIDFDDVTNRLREIETGQATAAIAGGAGERFKAFANALKESTLPLMTHIEKQLKDRPAPFGDGLLFHIRGQARLNQNKLPEAEADFGEALARGYVEGEVYFGRGWARLSMEHFADAEQDSATALQKGGENAPAYSLRGLARLNLKRFIEAEQDFTKAIELDETMRNSSHGAAMPARSSTGWRMLRRI